MAILTIRKLPEETKRGLQAMAAQKGHSMEAEVRFILENAVRPKNHLKLGDKLREIVQRNGGGLTEKEAVLMESVRKRTLSEPWNFDK